MHPYRALQVALDADSETIRQHYLAAIRQHPPEKDPEGFRLINEAYELIKTEEVRLAREMGAKRFQTSFADSPMEAAVLFFKASLENNPPSEDDFYTFLRS